MKVFVLLLVLGLVLIWSPVLVAPGSFATANFLGNCLWASVGWVLLVVVARLVARARGPRS